MQERRRFDPWVGKIPWRRKWQPTPVSLPGRSHRWGAWRLQSMELQRFGHNWACTQPKKTTFSKPSSQLGAVKKLNAGPGDVTGRFLCSFQETFYKRLQLLPFDFLLTSPFSLLGIVKRHSCQPKEVTTLGTADGTEPRNRILLLLLFNRCHVRLSCNAMDCSPPGSSDHGISR